MHVRTILSGGAFGLAALVSAGVAVTGAMPAASAAPTTVDFTFTGSTQTWTVPAGVTSVDATLCGAQGSAIDGTAGGLGARVATTLAVTPGEVLVIEVGGAGSNTTGGYNGGGDGGPNGGVGGGGATDVRQGGSSLADRVLVAGGGGATGPADISPSPNDGGVAGPTGTDGAPAPHAGQGGTATAGGAGGIGSGTGGSGVLGAGGDGDDTGSGGGGGLYGGGGGTGEPFIISRAHPRAGGAALSPFNGGGGGGGSSLAGSGTATAGVCRGDGTAVLSYQVSTTSSTTSSTTTTSTTVVGPSRPDGGVAGRGRTAPAAAPVSGTAPYTG